MLVKYINMRSDANRVCVATKLFSSFLCFSHFYTDILIHLLHWILYCFLIAGSQSAFLTSAQNFVVLYIYGYYHFFLNWNRLLHSLLIHGLLKVFQWNCDEDGGGGGDGGHVIWFSLFISMNLNHIIIIRQPCLLHIRNK